MKYIKLFEEFIGEAHKFKAGDEIEIEPIGINELKIKKI